MFGGGSNIMSSEFILVHHVLTSKEKQNGSWCPCCSPSCYLGVLNQDVKYLPLLRSIVMNSFLETELYVAQAGLDQGMGLKMALFLVYFHVCVVYVCIFMFALCEGTHAWGCTYVHIIHVEAQVEVGNPLPSHSLFY